MIVVDLLFLIVCSLSVSILYQRTEFQTKLREILSQLRDSQQIIKQRSDLANEIAHEIKNPLTAILCSAETLHLLLGDQLESAHQLSLKYIKEYGDSLLKLVSDFLDFSRAEIGRLEANPVVVKVDRAVESVIGLLEAKAIQHKIAIKYLAPENDLFVWIDENHLKQVLFNLIHNAIKFTPKGGEIHISAYRDFPKPLVKVAVKDNGVGLSEEQARRVFDIYERCAESEPSEDVGTGLGLSLCRALVKRAGGEIHVSSKVGIGSVFEFDLPIYEMVTDVKDQALIDSTATSIQQKIVHNPLVGQQYLLVDKDLGSRVSVAKLIEALGGIVDTVESATEAVEAFHSGDYDAVLIDQGADSFQTLALADQLSSDVKKKETKIIVASDESLELLKQHNTNVDQVISKPLNGKTLLQTLLKSGKYTVSH